ncbi:MAG: alpha/beta hydrolase, partial [Cyanobacteria bacterium]|nr:alpha/beta hydrolase [Cyanobacteriota bacterium]
METIQSTNVRDGLSVTLADGRKLGYAEYGDPNGRPLLYFHGGISCRLDISFAKEQLAAKNVKVLAPDRPGVGISDPKKNRSLLAWAEDVEQFLDALELPEVPLFGWSLGSAYVFPCMYKTPHRFSKIATIGSCAPFDSKEYIAELGLMLDRWLMTCPSSMRWSLKAVLNASGKM